MTAQNRLLFVTLLAAIAQPAAAANGGPVVKPLEGWLIGVLVIALITIFSRHRSSKSNAARSRSVARSEH